MLPLAVALLLACYLSPSVQAQTLDLIHTWSDGFSVGTASRDSYVDIDPDGNVFWAGMFQGTLDTGCRTLFSAGGCDIFLVKYDRDGVCVWDSVFGDPSLQSCSDVTSDPFGNVIIVGGFIGTVDFGGDPLSTGSFYIAKFDADGMHIWSDEYAITGGIVGHSVTTDASGNIIIAGTLSGTVDVGDGARTSAGGDDVFLAKFSPSGTCDWSRNYGDTSNDFAYDVVTDQSGNIIITGGFAGSIDFGDGENASLGDYDMFLAKFGPGGVLEWADTYGAEYDGDEVFGFNLDVDAEGNIAVVGSMEGIVWFREDEPQVVGPSPYSFLATFDPDGNGIWDAALLEITSGETPTGGFYYDFDLELDGAGNIYLGGTYFRPDFICGIGTPTASHNTFMVKLGPSGDEGCLDAQRFGESDAKCYDIAVDELGNVVLAGVFDTAIDFGGEMITGPGSFTFYLANFTQYDTDGDGIANEIDLEPTNFSEDFSDIPLGGTTTGSIVDRYWSSVVNPTRVTIKDEPSPEGVRCIVDVPRASVNSCGAIAGVDFVEGEYLITCSSMTLKADSAAAQALLGPDVSAEVSPGTSMKVEPLGGGQSEIENLIGSTGLVYVTVSEDTTELSAGESMITAIPEGPPVCSVSRDTVDFGSLDPGYSAQETFVIKNIGASILSGQVLGDCEVLRVDSLPGHHLAAGDSLIVTAYFDPAALGQFLCEIQTGNDDCGTVILKGEGEYLASVRQGDESVQAPRALLGVCRPNPVSQGTVVPLALPAPARVSLSIYDARGRLVLNLFSRDSLERM
jgi:hypothetical protein